MTVLWPLPHPDEASHGTLQVPLEKIPSHHLLFQFMLLWARGCNVSGQASVPARANGESCLVPSVAQSNAWVCYGQCSNRKHHHGALKDHEGNFIIGQFRIKAFLQFGYAKDRSHEYEDSCGRQSWREGSINYQPEAKTNRDHLSKWKKLTDEKSFEFRRLARNGVCRVEGESMAIHVECKVGA